MQNKNENKTNKNKIVDLNEINFHGAAVIDENGRETAITEDMIQTAFEKLSQISMLPSELR